MRIPKFKEVLTIVPIKTYVYKRKDVINHIEQKRQAIEKRYLAL